MSAGAQSTTSGGSGFTGLLAIVFITLKLLGVIRWSWWWVLCPLWAGLALIAATFALVFVGFLVAAVIKR